MRYFTRQLQEKMSHGPGSTAHDAVVHIWEDNGQKYAKELEKLKPSLNEGFRWLADSTLHDGYFASVERPTPKQIVMIVDAENNPWGPVGVFELRFDGVSVAEGLEDCLDAGSWLYEELHLDKNGIELSVLLESSEVRIIAKTLTVKSIKQ